MSALWGLAELDSQFFFARQLAEAHVLNVLLDFSAGSSIVQPNPSAGNQQPKLTPPALATATSEQLSAKVSQLAAGFVFSTTIFANPQTYPHCCSFFLQDAYAAKLKQALPEKLSTEASGVIKSAKSNLGLPEVDTTRIEATVSAALAADANALAALLPSLPTLKPQQLEKQRTNEAQQQTQQPQRTSRRVAAKRARDPEADVDPATLPPPKRVARMEALYNQLRALHDYNVTLSSSIRQLKGDLEKLNEENENLWAATAHIGAAMHAAIEERDAQAGEISFLPGSLGEEEPEELDHHHPLQHPHHHQHEPMPPSTAGGPTLVPQTQQVPQPTGRPPLLTPGTAGLAALFSPSGDDLFAACNMFISPTDRVVAPPATGAEKQLRAPLFPETAAAAPEIVAGRATSATEERRKDAQPALSDDKSFSFRL